MDYTKRDFERDETRQKIKYLGLTMLAGGFMGWIFGEMFKIGHAVGVDHCGKNLVERFDRNNEE